MRFARGGLRLLGMRSDCDELRTRRLNNRTRVMSAPCAKANQREPNGRVTTCPHQKRGAVVSGVAGVNIGLRPCTSLSLHVFNRGNT